MPQSADRPLVTLFVMAYNQERFVREAIEGAFAQTYTPLEIVLSDDNSSDGTFEVMQELAAAYDGPHRIILNRNADNLGIAQHIDRIVEISRGGLLILNAGDDVSRPDRVERMVTVWADARHRVKLVHSAAEMIDDTGRSTGAYRPRPLMIEAPTALNIIQRRLVALGATCAWDRELFDAFGPLGENLGVEDIVLSFRAAVLGEIAYVDEQLLGWRVGGLSWTSKNATTWDRIYGVGLRIARWRGQSAAHILDRFSEWDYPGRLEVERICRERAAQYGLIVEMAEATYGGRMALLPRVLRHALRYRSPYLLRRWLQYVLDKPYMHLMDARRGASSEKGA